MTKRVSPKLRLEIIPKIKLKDLSKLIVQYLKENGISKPSKSSVEGYNAIMQNILATKPHDTDCNIMIIGGRRTGKSNLSMVLIDMAKWILDKLKAESDIFMIVRQDALTIRRQLGEIQKNAHKYANEKYLLLSIDEAGKLAPKREAMSRKSREYVKLVQIMAAINSTVCYVAPRVADIDYRICDPDVIHILILVTRRGDAWVYSSRITDWLNFKGSVQWILRNQKEFDFISSFVSCGTDRLRGKFPPLAVLQVPKSPKYQGYRYNRVELVKQQLRELKEVW